MPERERERLHQWVREVDTHNHSSLPSCSTTGTEFRLWKDRFFIFFFFSAVLFYVEGPGKTVVCVNQRTGLFFYVFVCGQGGKIKHVRHQMWVYI